jgi:hypothetical protein
MGEGDKFAGILAPFTLSVPGGCTLTVGGPPSPAGVRLAESLDRMLAAAPARPLGVPGPPAEPECDTPTEVRSDG